MKKNGFTLQILLAVVVLMAIAGLAFAGSVYDRATATASTTAGTATWTNAANYAALALKRVWVENCLVTNQVCTVSRISYGGAYTQTVATVSCAAATSGSSASFTAGYLKPGDQLTFSGSISTGYTAMVEYELQAH